MARTRNIKPGFFKNETLAELGPGAMLLFAGLWTLADREGRLECRPKRIKAEIFPYFTLEIDPLLADLVKFGFLVQYQRDGNTYLSIPSWGKHQNPHHREQPSLIPAPDLPSTSLGLLPDLPSTSLEQAVPCFLASLTPSTLTLEPEPKANPKKVSAKPKPVESGGEAKTFMDAYPKRTGIQLGIQTYISIVEHWEHAEVLAGLQRWKTSKAWAEDGGKWIPEAAKWLTDRRWKDDPQQAASATGHVFGANGGMVEL